jgi:hypothetical protein
VKHLDENTIRQQFNLHPLTENDSFEVVVRNWRVEIYQIYYDGSRKLKLTVWGGDGGETFTAEESK